MKNEIWVAILGRTASWNEIIEFINFYKSTEMSNFGTLQLLCFSDIEHYAAIKSASGEPVDDLFYSYLKFFFWPLVYPNGYYDSDSDTVS